MTAADTRVSALLDQRDRRMDSVVDQFHALADEYLEHALRGESHRFSNVSDTLAELCQGVNKSRPCGAGVVLLGVGPLRRHRAVPSFC